MFILTMGTCDHLRRAQHMFDIFWSAVFQQSITGSGRDSLLIFTEGEVSVAAEKLFVYIYVHAVISIGSEQGFMAVAFQRV